MSNTTHEFTRLLLESQQGSRTALDRLLPILDTQLRAIADRLLRRGGTGRALQPTALAHEAYLLLVDQSAVGWQSRLYFFAFAAHQVRQVLVDYAKWRQAAGRPDSVAPPTLSDAGDSSEQFDADEVEADVVALHEALEALARMDARLARVAELRHFGGLSTPAVAEILRMDPATAEQEWRVARAWLRTQLQSVAA